MATKSENADIRELQTQMGNAVGDISEIKGDLKDIKLLLTSGSLVSQQEFSSYKHDQEKKFTDYKRSQNWQKFFLAIGMLVIGALVTNFFSNIGG